MMTTDMHTIALSPVRKARPRRSRLRINGYLFFILPGVLIVLALTLFPALYGIYISLTNFNLGYATSSFVGLENYWRFFTWPDLGLVARNTATFVGSVVLLQASIGLLVAILLNQRVIGHQFMRSITILPWVLPSVVVGLVFAQIFGGSRLGFANYVLSLFGIGQMAWFSDPALAMVILIAVSTWRGVPFSVIILLGGLQTLPRDVYEAAIIDGTSRWQRFRYITLPLLKPIIMISLIMGTGGALNSLDIPLALTGGGPGNATELISISLYKQSFFQLDVSYGATIGTMMLVVNLILIVLYLVVLQPRRSAPND
ncbi:MAG TPA: sugar ABC transporter permease [Devosiaceae bacterium]|jgi:multiple sugar transport system permease protein